MSIESEAATEIVSMLTAATTPAGPLRVVTDPHDANPPCVWLQPAEVTHVGLSAQRLIIVWHLWLIATDVDTIAALEQIGDMRAAVASVGGPIRPANPAAWLPLQLPGDHAKPLPALRLTLAPTTVTSQE